VNSIPEHQQKTFPASQPLRQVHTITDRFSIANTYIVNDEQIIIVDPGSELNVRLAFQYLQRVLKRTPAEIDLIVLTQLQPDHSAGVEFLRRAARVPIAASAAARQFVQARHHLFPGEGAFSSHHASQIRMVDIWLEDVAALHQHPDWRVIASPGHAPESLCLYNPFTYEFLCGDTLILTEGGTPLLHSGTNRQQLVETLGTLRNLEIHYLYPGHGRALLREHPFANLAVE
jgi:hydroxyacylglutathione hydrolase